MRLLTRAVAVALVAAGLGVVLPAATPPAALADECAT